MVKIKWSRSLCVGIAEIDESNKQLIQTFNLIEKHRDDDVTAEPVSLVVEQMRKNASVYFSREERYMRNVDYPHYYAHKDEHKQFREKTAALCIDVMNRKKTTPIDIYNYLSGWIIDHILHADKEIARFVEKNRHASRHDLATKKAH